MQVHIMYLPLVFAFGMTQVFSPDLITLGVENEFDNMDKLAERCDEDDRFCVVCLRTRNDVPVIDHCCYSCGGEGQEVLLQ